MKRCILCAAIVLGLASSSIAQQSDADKLQGTWEITALVDDGALVPDDLLKLRFATDARFTISGQSISFLKPGSLEKRTLLFVTNEKASPKTIDIAGADKTSGKGIYLLSDDVLMFCFADAESKERPTEFSAKKGEPNLLFTLKRIKAIEKKPVPEPKVVVKEAPKEAMKDDQIRKILLGTWGHQNEDWVTMFTLNTDGTFSSRRSYKKRVGKFFNEDTTSSGNWKLQDGVVICNITASTDRDLLLQIFSYRIRSISATELIAVDQFGGLRREWKAR